MSGGVHLMDVLDGQIPSGKRANYEVFIGVLEIYKKFMKSLLCYKNKDCINVIVLQIY